MKSTKIYQLIELILILIHLSTINSIELNTVTFNQINLN